MMRFVSRSGSPLASTTWRSRTLPTEHGLAAAVAEHWLALPFAAILGVEHAAADPVPDGGSTRRYGSTAVTIYSAGVQPSDREITS